MVFFTCNACGQAIKKAQVEKHYLTKCRNCEVLSCMDCGKDFVGDDYKQHTQCITEDEKYGGKDYQAPQKANKGEAKQEQWLQRVRESCKAGDIGDNIKDLLERIAEYPNVPRKKKKFENFVRNSVRVHNPKIMEQIWNVFSAASAKQETHKPAQPVSSDVNQGGTDSSRLAQNETLSADNTEKEPASRTALEVADGSPGKTSPKKSKHKKSKWKVDEGTGGGDENCGSARAAEVNESRPGDVDTTPEEPKATKSKIKKNRKDGSKVVESLESREGRCDSNDVAAGVEEPVKKKKKKKKETISTKDNDSNLENGIVEATITNSEMPSKDDAIPMKTKSKQKKLRGSKKEIIATRTKSDEEDDLRTIGVKEKVPKKKNVKAQSVKGKVSSPKGSVQSKTGEGAGEQGIIKKVKSKKNMKRKQGEMMSDVMQQELDSETKLLEEPLKKKVKKRKKEKNGDSQTEAKAASGLKKKKKVKTATTAIDPVYCMVPVSLPKQTSSKTVRTAKRKNDKASSPEIGHQNLNTESSSSEEPLKKKVKKVRSDIDEASKDLSPDKSREVKETDGGKVKTKKKVKVDKLSPSPKNVDSTKCDGSPKILKQKTRVINLTLDPSDMPTLFTLKINAKKSKESKAAILSDTGKVSKRLKLRKGTDDISPKENTSNVTTKVKRKKKSKQGDLKSAVDDPNNNMVAVIKGAKDVSVLNGSVMGKKPKKVKKVKKVGVDEDVAGSSSDTNVGKVKKKKKICKVKAGGDAVKKTKKKSDVAVISEAGDS